MIDVALTLVALIGAGVSLELFTSATAPASNPMSEGLYLIPETHLSIEEMQTGNPS